ncbi:UDP-N-acetylmuramate dehydrogenase [Marinobacterium halophilum]|uniref:UDP-N-acetylenolpyruvoylglucosamine reductase n=1 Tax=Marinobacterium halophilum TaxID=267374 RepID=A0A2P8F0A2_9GAMM|nr:UDP-N-acetylmuramate dehydrogenase [Marinobacterium halophilum]PSL15140.1 UDP-N-acetylmuramate dehydrogenase [Marinobacterium halophilum]
MLQFKNHVPLSEHNTFGFDVEAEQLVTITEPGQLVELQEWLERNPQPLLVLGGGSNLVLSADIPGVVARMAIRRWDVAFKGDEVSVWVGAGENWHETVERTLFEGFYGLENLALIPGTVGAAPVQNIGAYGVEIKDRLGRVEVFDRQNRVLKLLDNADCLFAYRDSLFKSGEPDRYIITAVEFRLSRVAGVQVGYAALDAAIEKDGPVTPRQVFDAVCRVRRQKLPSPEVLGNAGSFFKNPLVSVEQGLVLKAQEPDLVAYPDVGGGYKLAAGWLIDRCGLKGYRQGNVGTYPEQALVVVNWGRGNRTEVEQLADYIQQQVMARFGVWLEPEPRFYP